MAPASTLTLKRKNIDLPVESWQKLAVLAVSQGLSLKAYVEKILNLKASAVEITIHENPSPSGDPWFDDPENIAMIDRAVEEARTTPGREFSSEDFRKALGL